MENKTLVAVIAFVILMSASLFSAWKFSNIFNHSFVESANLNNSSKASLINKIFSNKQKILVKEIMNLTSAEQIKKMAAINKTSSNALSTEVKSSNVLVLNLLRYDSINSRWVFDWTSVNNTNYFLSENLKARLLKSLPLARVNSNNITFSRIMNDRGEPLLAVMSPFSKDSISLSIYNMQKLIGLSNLSKGEEGQIYVVDNKGYALAFPDKKYVGHLVEDELVEEIIKKQQPVGTLKYYSVYDNLVTGTYQKITGTNAYLIVQTKVKNLSALTMSFLKSNAIAYIGLLVVFIGLIWFILTPIEERNKFMIDSLISMATGRPVKSTKYLTANDSVLIDSINKIQIKLYNEVVSSKSEPMMPGEFSKMAFGLVSSLEGPVNSILGNAQLARANASSLDEKQFYTMIEREAKKSQKILDNLKEFSIDSEGELKKVEIENVILNALKSVSEIIDEYNIRVEKELNTNPIIKIDEIAIQKAIEEVLKNAIESMSESPSRLLKIKLEEDGSFVRLIIEDSGNGVPTEIINKIFEPFYSTKLSKEGRGLGLTLARANIEASNGFIHIESQPNLGARFVIQLPLLEATAVKPLKVEEQAQTITDMKPLTGSLAATLPTAPDEDEITFVGIVDEDKLKYED